MAFLQGTTGRLHVRSWPVTAPRAVVVLLHGLGEHAGLYEFLAGELGRAGYELWVPDHHGHGHSDGERVLVRGLDVLQDDAELVLAHVAAERPGVPLVLAGHSLGAVTAALLVGERGVRPIALVLRGVALGSTD